MKSLLILSVLLSSFLCAKPTVNNSFADLSAELDSIAHGSKGKIGIAVISPDNDTVSVNNNSDYPLMSVFKLHEAIAASKVTDNLKQSLDSLVSVRQEELSTNTWSPMLKDFPEESFNISVGDLIRYSLLVSDNNASNLIFEKVVSTNQTDSIIRTLMLPDSFQIRYTERQMQQDHKRIYENRASPLSCASLIKKLFSDSIVSKEKQDSIISWLGQCTSASTRMQTAVDRIEGATLYHRTGSGYIKDNGEISAVNDVGVIELPDGRLLTVAILIKDYAGKPEEADNEIAEITTRIIEYYK